MFVILIFGIYFNLIIESMVFMISYIYLRSYVGGFHLKSKVSCFATSVIINVFTLLVIKYNVLNNNGLYNIEIISTILILLFSPFENNNKPLSNNEKRILKKLLNLK